MAKREGLRLLVCNGIGTWESDATSVVHIHGSMTVDAATAKSSAKPKFDESA
jgi:hypothetical protein